MTREEEIAKVRHRAADAAEDRVLDALLPRAPGRVRRRTPRRATTTPGSASEKCCAKRELDEREIEIEVRATAGRRGDHGAARHGGNDAAAAGHVPEPGRRPQTRPRKLKIKEALKLLVDEEAAKMINEEELKARAVENAEQNGIVFIDEIDKIARRQETAGADVSREGVQRDLLPLVEGCTVNTKYGTVKTDHVLFIASGAFHMSKPSDLIPELQGRLPIRVELEPLVVQDFVRILTEPDASLCRQYAALLATEGVELAVRGIRRAAPRRGRIRGQRADREHRCAPPAHRHGAAAWRRVSFDAADRSGTRVVIDRELRRGQSRRAGRAIRTCRGTFCSRHASADRHQAAHRIARSRRALRRRLAFRAAVRISARVLPVRRGHGSRRGRGHPADRQGECGHQRASSPSATTRCGSKFDDGHDTGLYSWTLLHELGRAPRANWARYLERCAAAGSCRAARALKAARPSSRLQCACTFRGAP